MDILLLLLISSSIMLYKLLKIKKKYKDILCGNLEQNYLKLIALRRKGFKDIYVGSYLLFVLIIGVFLRFFEQGNHDNQLFQWLLIIITFSIIVFYVKITKNLFTELNNIQNTFENVDKNLYNRLIEVDKFLNTFKKLRKESFIYFKLTRKKYKKSKQTIKVLIEKFDLIWSDKFNLTVENNDIQNLNMLTESVYDLYKHLKYLNRVSETPLTDAELAENLVSLQNSLIAIENLFKKGE